MPRSLRHWEITREKGMWAFILQTGLGWGALMFGFNLSQANPRRYSILVTFGIWLAGGVIVAIFVWISSERRYRRHMGVEGKAMANGQRLCRPK